MELFSENRQAVYLQCPFEREETFLLSRSVAEWRFCPTVLQGCW